MRLNKVFIKLKLITCATLLLLSCKGGKEKVSETNHIKFITKFDPAFDESLEIIFINSEIEKKLSLLIKKDLFRNVSTEGINDTSYFKSIDLDSHQTELVYDSILNFWNFHRSPNDIVILDGIYVTYSYIRDKDTTYLSYQSLSKSDTVTYRFNNAILNTYQSLLKDSIITSYFNEIRKYLGDSVESTDVSPYMRLMMKGYPRQLRYNPPK